MVVLCPLATDSSSQLDVFGHDCDAFGVNGAEVGVLKETNQVGLAGFLKSHDGRALETEIGFEILSNLADKSLEGELANEELGALLVATNLTESNSSWPVTMGLLDATGGGSAFTGCLGGELFAWSLASSGLSGSLLCSSHAVCSRRRQSGEFRGKNCDTNFYIPSGENRTFSLVGIGSSQTSGEV